MPITLSGEVERVTYESESTSFRVLRVGSLEGEGARRGSIAVVGTFQAVASGRATHGILPVENSIGGSIHRNYDLLIEHDLPIVGEVELPIRHHLLALPGTRIDQLTRIYSHPQALAQCEKFLRELPG